MSTISKDDVIAVQNRWSDGIVAISALHKDGGDYVQRAKDHINTLYGYDRGEVMFKPTLASEKQFRGTFEDALDYFVGKEGTEDGGFAIAGWTHVRWERVGIVTTDTTALSMGNYFFTGPDGSETKVEFSFGYVKDEDGQLKINLHHSSVPYTPE